MLKKGRLGGCLPEVIIRFVPCSDVGGRRCVFNKQPNIKTFENIRKG